MYLPLHSESEKSYILRFKFNKFAKLTVSLPLAGFTICVVLSIVKDFESANFTHCNVYNVFPSVSAAIGTYYPQYVIWKLTIATHSIPRYIVALLYYQHYTKIISRRLFYWVWLLLVLNFAEISSLIGLSFWSSSENYPVHRACFITFVATSQTYMIISCVLLQWFKLIKLTELQTFSLRLKWYLFWINFLSFLLAAYFFMRHNSYCEPMVYSMFAASEYLVILTNMAFHMTSCYDFEEKHVYIRDVGISVH